MLFQFVDRSTFVCPTPAPLQTISGVTVKDHKAASHTVIEPTSMAKDLSTGSRGRSDSTVFKGFWPWALLDTPLNGLLSYAVF